MNFCVKQSREYSLLQLKVYQYISDQMTILKKRLASIKGCCSISKVLKTSRWLWALISLPTHGPNGAGPPNLNDIVITEFPDFPSFWGCSDTLKPEAFESTGGQQVFIYDSRKQSVEADRIGPRQKVPGRALG